MTGSHEVRGSIPLGSTNYPISSGDSTSAVFQEIASLQTNSPKPLGHQCKWALPNLSFTPGFSPVERHLKMPGNRFNGFQTNSRKALKRFSAGACCLAPA